LVSSTTSRGSLSKVISATSRASVSAMASI
jgi:hypothetical protein